MSCFDVYYYASSTHGLLLRSCAVMYNFYSEFCFPLSLSLSLSLSLPFTETCEQYNNYGFCHSIGGYNGNSTVYVDRSPSKWGQLGLSSVEPFLENLLRQLTDVGNSTWTPGCEHTVRQLLCQATLPLCKNQGEHGKAERV